MKPHLFRCIGYLGFWSSFFCLFICSLVLSHLWETFTFTVMSSKKEKKKYFPSPSPNTKAAAAALSQKSQTSGANKQLVVSSHTKASWEFSTVPWLWFPRGRITPLLRTGYQEKYKRKSLQWQKGEQGTHACCLSCSAVDSVSIPIWNASFTPAPSHIPWAPVLNAQSLVCGTVLKSVEIFGIETSQIQEGRYRWTFAGWLGSGSGLLYLLSG